MQRELDEKTRQVAELKVSLSKAKSDAKDADVENAKWQETVEIIQEKLAAMQTSVKRQAGVIEIFEANERASDKRFGLLHSENARLRAFNKKVLAAQQKIATEVSLRMNSLLALHPDETDTDTTEQLDRERNFEKRTAADAESSSDSESEVAPAPAAGAPAEPKEGEAPPLATQTTEVPVADRSMSAETLPMSPRIVPMEATAHVADMPEPSTNLPVAFEPAPAPSAPGSQQAMSAVV